MLAVVDPADIMPIIGVKCGLIMMPHDSATHHGPSWNKLKACISPLAKCGSELLPSWEKHILVVSHDILPFMSIYELTPQIFGPSVFHDAHPTLCGFE